MKAAPTSGRTSRPVRIPKPNIISPASQQIPGHQARDADQHGEGIVIDKTGLEPDDAVGDIDHPSRDAIGAETVDDEAVALLPEEAAEPFSRTNEQEVVDLVEIPLVEQEAVQDRVRLRELAWHVRAQHVAVERADEAEHHRDKGR